MTDHSDCNSCSDSSCAAKAQNPQENDEQFQTRQRLEQRLCHIDKKVLVMSGKGGVGKSTTAVNLALALAKAGKQVGLLDIDLHGPSLPTMLGLNKEQIFSNEEGLIPLEFEGVKVISIGFMIQDDTQAMIMRGPVKHGAIQQFLADVNWGELDYLVIDCPPGTGDEPLTAAQLLGKGASAVIVTTPQDVALVDVEKSVSFCNELNLNLLGIVENMSGFSCPHCGEVSDIFKSGGGETLATKRKVPFLGRVPLDPRMVQSGDSGKPFILEHPDSEAAQALQGVVNKII
ncbi:MAG: Mrp/NBP35 family ATP-binding protein [Desulfuromonadales bacterium]|nr:Mrp/NBP35 family ATP-binding protein [Desulfuromonadales bacterium]